MSFLPDLEKNGSLYRYHDDTEAEFYLINNTRGNSIYLSDIALPDSIDNKRIVINHLDNINGIALSVNQG